MKNLMIYFSSTGSFNNPRKGWPNDENTLIKIQIDNSLDLDWKKEDILLFTNFEYQYGDIKATVFNNSEFSREELELMKQVPEASKTIFAAKMFEKGLIDSNKKDEIYWLHDLDSFQLQPITDSELKLDEYDAGAVNYPIARMPGIVNYHTSTVFFKPSAKDIFLTAVKILFEKNIDPKRPFDDEHALNWLCNTDQNLRKRIKDLGYRYTIKRYQFERYLDAIKPIKIAHLRPNTIRPDKMRGNLRSFDKFVSFSLQVGEKELHVSVLPERIIKIFKKHGVESNVNNMKDMSPAIIDLWDLETKNKRFIWKPFLEKYDCQTVCELGVREGENFKLMIEHQPREAIAVDSWIDDGISSHNDLGFTQEILNKQYQDFTIDMADKPFVKIYREYTNEAVKHFPDNYFDLVYLDADHTYEACQKDIENWFPKIKKGKFLVGHDYTPGFLRKTNVRFGVIEAVDNFVKNNNLRLFKLPFWHWVIIKP